MLYFLLAFKIKLYQLCLFFLQLDLYQCHFLLIYFPHFSSSFSLVSIFFLLLLFLLFCVLILETFKLFNLLIFALDGKLERIDFNTELINDAFFVHSIDTRFYFILKLDDIIVAFLVRILSLVHYKYKLYIRIA